MSTVQKELITTINGLSEDTAQIILEMIKQVVVPLDKKKNDTKKANSSLGSRIGSRKGVKFVADGHDIDDYNDEVEEMFGVR